MKRQIELLAPAGTIDKLETALHFGADAVYCGSERYSLRAGSANIATEQLEQAIAMTHAAGKKFYLALNVYAHEADFDGLAEYLRDVAAMGVDAFIVSDAGILTFCQQYAPKVEIHLSTQANTTNRYAAMFWVKQGVKRIVVAREMPLNEIAKMREYLPEEIGIEAFVHGAMCISYSGRCLLSNVLSNRPSNHGDCVQACRWEYEIREKNRGGLPLTIGQEDRGTYILNSRDLNMIGYLDKLIDAGADSLKIEGRMKSESYVAGTVHAYRLALDAYLRDPQHYRVDPYWEDILNRVSHRPYGTGLYFPGADNVYTESSRAETEYTFVARVLGYDEAKQCAIIEQRNRFAVGAEVEILSANAACDGKTLTVSAMTDTDGNAVTDALRVQQTLLIPTPLPMQRGDIWMKKVEV